MLTGLCEMICTLRLLILLISQEHKKTVKLLQVAHLLFKKEILEKEFNIFSMLPNTHFISHIF